MTATVGVVRRHSAFIKLSVITVLGLLLMAPLGLVQGLVDERQVRSEQVVREVRATWGGDQMIKGPLLLVPYRDKAKTESEWSLAAYDWAYVYADELTIDANIAGRELHRGLFHVNAFDGQVEIKGRLPKVDLKAWGLEGKEIAWDKARISVLTPGGALLAGAAHRFRALGADSRLTQGVPALDGAGLSAPLDLSAHRLEAALPFSLSLAMKGTGDIGFMPIATVATVGVKSDWDSPHFFGPRLPDERQVGDGGFAARWSLADAAADSPGPFGTTLAWLKTGDSATFGVRLVTPVTDYFLIHRAIKHGLLFIVMTFAMFLLFEVLAGIDVHPLQYLLVGLALAVFYILLVSLAEHVTFSQAYAASSAAVVTLTFGYTRVILGGGKRALLVGSILSATYGILYVTLKAEQFALLSGSLSLFAALAAVMYLTRHVNWYAVTLRKRGETA